MAAMDTSTNMTVERLAEFGEAWHRKDLEKLLEFITDDCVYRASVGPDPGETFSGRNEVRNGFARMLAYDTGAERHGATVLAVAVVVTLYLGVAFVVVWQW